MEHWKKKTVLLVCSMKMQRREELFREEHLSFVVVHADLFYYFAKRNFESNTLLTMSACILSACIVYSVFFHGCDRVSELKLFVHNKLFFFSFSFYNLPVICF